jgi:hypothetical protein
VDGLIAFGEAPSEEDAEGDGAGEEGAAAEKGGGRAIFVVEGEHWGLTN